MIDLHLLRKILFEPFVFFDVVIDELDSQLTVYLNGCFSRLTVVEPCLRPPSDTTLVGINTDESRYIKALYVNLKLGKRIDESTTGYGFVIGFFFNA
jgi:hypothetical protein